MIAIAELLLYILARNHKVGIKRFEDILARNHKVGIKRFEDKVGVYFSVSCNLDNVDCTKRKK